jgi:outer membrane protein insertion porin family
MPDCFKHLLCTSVLLLVANSVLWGVVMQHLPEGKKFQVRQIAISGNEAFDDAQVEKWLKIKRGQAVTTAILRQAGLNALAELRDHGFYFSRIDSIGVEMAKDSDDIDVVFYLHEGNEVAIAGITYAGIPDDHKDVLDELRLRKDAPFRERGIEDDIETIVSHFEMVGYPYCKVNIDSINMRESADAQKTQVDIFVQLDPGPLVSIKEIDIAGNEQTRDAVILRELRFSAGDIYDQKKIDKIRPALMRLGYFRFVNPPRLEYLGDGDGKLIIELAEGSPNHFDGILGYNPSTATSEGFVTGLIDLAFGNLFGTGRELDARWEKRTQETQELEFRYTEPWIAGFPVNATVDFAQLIQDTIYVERRFGLGLQYIYNDNLAFTSRVSRLNISPDSLGVLYFGIPKSSSTNLGLAVSFNTIDNLLNPSRGLVYHTSFDISKKVVADSIAVQPQSKNHSFQQERLTIDFETFIPLFKWQILALAVHGKQITSDEEIIPVTEQYRLGGTRTLRGYREEQFRGSRIAWANIEYRYLFGKLSRFFAFLDVGYFFREELLDSQLRKIEDTRFGYGIGIRINTKLGFFGIDYGLGEGDSLSDGKVHVGLINEF